MYNNLMELVKNEYDKNRKERIQNIANDENILKHYSTSTRWQAYKKGSLTHDKAVELATKRGLKEIDQREQEKLFKLETAFHAKELQFVDITVEWKKSRTWGNNPYVTIRTNDGVFYGSASGCGYDKESAAIAEALNQSASVMKMLYDKKEICSEKSNHKYLGYGSGYGVLPYFEGGVGVNSHRSVFNNCGYTWETVSSGKTFDVYRITKRIEEL